MTTPEISIVVCTYNRADMLRLARASLYSLAMDDQFTHEILVIDNASTDVTPAPLAAAPPESAAPLRGVYKVRKGIAAACNRGIREARGRWIAIFDHDQVADPRRLAELFCGTREQRCRVVGGAVRLMIAPDERVLHSTALILLGKSYTAPQPRQYGGCLTPAAAI